MHLKSLWIWIITDCLWYFWEEISKCICPMEKIAPVSPYRYFFSPRSKLRLLINHYETPCSFSWSWHSSASAFCYFVSNSALLATKRKIGMKLDKQELFIRHLQGDHVLFFSQMKYMIITLHSANIYFINMFIFIFIFLHKCPIISHQLCTNLASNNTTQSDGTLHCFYIWCVG